MQRVIFYTKLNCGLCDEAHRMLMDLAFDLPMEIDVLDITHRHHKLGNNYNERIPVIAIPDAEKELDWPFTIDDIRAYLAQYAS